MKAWKLVLPALLACSVALLVVISCGDDDDDDAGGDGWSCTEACEVIYNDCAKLVTIEGIELSNTECIEGCNQYGGVDNCMAVCLDNYTYDEDCQEIEECLIECSV